MSLSFFHPNHVLMCSECIQQTFVGADEARLLLGVVLMDWGDRVIRRWFVKLNKLFNYTVVFCEFVRLLLMTLMLY